MNKMPFIFHTAVNYRLLEKLSAGLGAGVEFYRETYLPVTINGIYRFNNNRIAHFKEIKTYDVIPLNKFLFMIGDDGFYLYDYDNLQDIKLSGSIPVKKQG